MRSIGDGDAAPFLGAPRRYRRYKRFELLRDDWDPAT